MTSDGHHDVEFRVLGPVQIGVAGSMFNAGEPRRRTVLAALLLDAGQVVPAATLIDRVWGDSPPGSAHRTLATHITRLRRVLEHTAGDGEPPRLVGESGGYRLAVDRSLVDVHLFRDLVRTRGAARDDRVLVKELREALTLWRGQPLTGTTGEWADRTRQHLAAERLAAVAAWGEAEVRVGNPANVLAELSQLADEHPLMEPLTAALVRALVAAGRPSEALERCRLHRRHLIEEHGTDQSPQLRALYQSVLRGDLTDPLVGNESARLTRRPHDGPIAALAVSAELPAPAALPAPALPAELRRPHRERPPERGPQPAAPEPRTTTAVARPAVPRRIRRLLAGLTAVLLLAGATALLRPWWRGDVEPAGHSSSEPTGHSGLGPPIVEEFTGHLDTVDWSPYDDRLDNGSIWAPDHVRAAQGELQIIGETRNRKGATGNISGGVCWQCSHGPYRTYGRWEIRAKFDGGAGYAPEIGLYPASGEETDGLITAVHIDHPDRIRLVPMVSEPGHDPLSLYGTPQTGDFSDWTTYAVEWRPGWVRIEADGRTILDTRQKPGLTVPSAPMYLYIQQLVGPIRATPPPDASTPSRVGMHVDWVRYYPLS
jgi:SARP family transcriptional regulator, regulator of embCAB operon